MPRFDAATLPLVDVFEIDIAALDHLLSAPADDPAALVFRSPDLVRKMATFQHGYDELTMTLFAVLRRVYLPHYDLHDTVPEALMPLRALLPWWLAKHAEELPSLPAAVQPPLLCYATITGNTAVVEALHAASSLVLDPLHWDLLGRHGHTKLLQLLIALGYSGDLKNVLENAAIYGHVSMVSFLQDFGVAVTWETLMLACVSGRIEVAQFAHDLISGPDCCWDPETVDCAARRGHLSIIRFMHQYDYSGFSSQTMDMAAENGHLEVVRFLHEHRGEGCTSAAMLGAVRFGHLEVVTFLDLYRPDAHADNILVIALHYGQQAILDYFQEERKLKKRFSRIQKKVAVLVRRDDSLRNLYHGPKSKLCCA
ncbi:hypothetical protein ACHHYP_06140 [Achlya hypogyna]|uniref:Ankyrin repeat protein n=1 Tax=Achlya hypogyna TaxID=1202772 RepID=A0A1V9YV85_ACHHY|nr:hypothetical protein ACHHYP_06140 [Achlya hypogyna]